MKVRAENMKIKVVFTKGQYTIPAYQREYDWDSDNIEELLKDIEACPDDDNYFIGHMVFEGNINGSSFNVIDGQQRITTLTLLLCAIRDTFLKLGNEELAMLIHTRYIFSRDDNNAEFGILNNMMPYPVLQARIQSLPIDRDNSVAPVKIGEKKLIKAFGQLIKYLKDFDIERLIKLRDRVLNLETIFVAAEGLADAYSIFKTLNATGKDLAPIDLVKSLIFSLYPKNPILHEPDDSWKKMLENLNCNEGDPTKVRDKFLNNFYASRYKKVSDNALYKHISNVIDNSPEKAKKFVLDLRSDSEHYKYVIYPQVSDWSNNDYDIYESLNAMSNIFDIKVANAFLLALVRDYRSGMMKKKVLVNMLHTMERFHFINNAVCSNRSSGMDIRYAAYAKKLFNATDKTDKNNVMQELCNFLNTEIPSKEEYKALFNSRIHYSDKDKKAKALSFYVLSKLERNKNTNGILTHVNIEHVYPQTGTPDWPNLSDNDNIHQIGNLVLLDITVNSSIGNAKYDVKKTSILNQTQLVTTKELLESHDSWTEADIMHRTNEIIDQMYDL